MRAKLLRTLRRLVPLVGEHGERREHAEAGSAAGAQHERGHAEPPRNVQERQKVGVGDEARDVVLPRCLLLRLRRRQQRGQALPERSLTGAVHGEDVLDGHLEGIRAALRRQAVGDDGHGDEVVGRVAGLVGGVEVGVEDGDGEPARVEEAGELEHGVDVALVREREEQHAAAPVAGGGVSSNGTH